MPCIYIDKGTVCREGVPKVHLSSKNIVELSKSKETISSIIGESISIQVQRSAESKIIGEAKITVQSHPLGQSNIIAQSKIPA